MLCLRQRGEDKVTMVASNNDWTEGGILDVRRLVERGPQLTGVKRSTLVKKLGTLYDIWQSVKMPISSVNWVGTCVQTRDDDLHWELRWTRVEKARLPAADQETTNSQDRDDGHSNRWSLQHQVL